MAQLEPLPPVTIEPIPNGAGNYMARAPFDPALLPWERPPIMGNYGQPQPPTGPFVDGVPLPVKPSAGRDGMLQKFAFITGWLPKFSDGGQQNVDAQVYAMLGVPFPSRESPLLVTPGFEVNTWDGPAGADLPSAVYDAYVEFLWLHQWNDRLTTYIGAEPGWHSDLQSSDEEGMRVTAQVIADWTWSPEWKMIVGAKYLDRDDVLFLPIAGMVWTPCDGVKWEMVFPKPKLAWRTWTTGEVENWWYIGGELGGGIWGIERAGGALDVVTTRDYRLFTGTEWRSMIGGWTSRLELGYVFGRVIEYQNSALPDVKPADTLMLRAGLIY